jgi:predicted acyltransferase
MKMKNRLLSLDVFRGFTICFMIIVNTPGDWSIAYEPLKHAAWHGFTPTDLVFPSFVFITGVSSWFSFKSYNHTLTSALFMKIWKRAFIIFLLGVGLYAFPFYNKPISNWRILGVLQRIALCYGVGATLGLLFKPKQLIGVCVALLLGYWGILTAFGDLTMQGNAGQKLDLWLFGDSHLYHGEGIAFDPEGFLSTMPSIVTYLIGYLIGGFMGTTDDKEKIMRTLSIIGMALVVGGLIWNFAFPINKKLWTSSYVLFAGGLSTLIFTLCYYILDIKKVYEWSHFFRIFGTNAILAYMVSELLIIILELMKINEAPDIVINGHDAFYRYFFALWLGSNNFSSFLFAIAFMMICWLVVYIFYRRGIFLKV